MENPFKFLLPVPELLMGITGLLIRQENTLDNQNKTLSDIFLNIKQLENIMSINRVEFLAHLASLESAEVAAVTAFNTLTAELKRINDEKAAAGTLDPDYTEFATIVDGIKAELLINVAANTPAAASLDPATVAAAVEAAPVFVSPAVDSAVAVDPTTVNEAPAEVQVV